jgi:hypothetical protein
VERLRIARLGERMEEEKLELLQDNRQLQQEAQQLQQQASSRKEMKIYRSKRCEDTHTCACCNRTSERCSRMRDSCNSCNSRLAVYGYVDIAMQQ